MPVKKRGSKAINRGRTPEFCDQQLIEGPDLLLAGVGYFDLVPSKPAYLDQASEAERAIILSAMRADWLRRRERILAEWNGDGLPWAEREFCQNVDRGQA